jgi:hypothetical protein
MNKKLTNKMCADAETAGENETIYYLSDGSGLSLQIDNAGRKYWRLFYYMPSLQRTKSLMLGVFPTMSLGQARKEADEFRRIIKLGVDPVKVKSQKKRALYEQCIENNLLEDEDEDEGE